jgi:DNA-binding LytR/AlgR family response regulator
LKGDNTIVYTFFENGNALLCTKGGYNLKIKLNISSERYNEIKFALEERGIEIDDTADLVLSEANSFIDNLIVREKGTKARIILPVEDIVYIESFGHAVEVQTLKAVYQATDRLYRIISLLDPEKFLRISNSVIIARNKVKRITPTLSSKFILTMINGKSVDVTRSYYYIFKEYFGI